MPVRCPRRSAAYRYDSHLIGFPRIAYEWSHDDLGAPPLFIPLVVATAEV